MSEKSTMLQDAIAVSPVPDRRTLERNLVGVLSAAAKLDASSADRALRLAAESGQRLELVLTSLGLVGEGDLAGALAETLGLPIATARDFPEAPALAEKVSPRFLHQFHVFPIGVGPGGVAVAMADPADAYAIRALELCFGVPVEPHVAAPSNVEAALERWEGRSHHTMAEFTEAADHSGDDRLTEDIDRLRDLASEAPVIRMVNLVIIRAIESRASDIHVEPFGSALVVRYRIDGVLCDGPAPPPRLQAAIVSRIKIMARMDIAERRLPQDGRIRFVSRGREFDLRISSVPTLHGEAVVIRILDRASLAADFATLGFWPDVESGFAEVISQSQGITLVTGPTGSGKTTTLYTGLLRLNDPGKKLFTIEDPIEYELDGVNQVQVKTQIDLSFARILRAILRHDPDIVMIGEIRDFETASVAAQAALTGHTVLSTLHTNDAASAVTRLLDMGVESYLVASTLNAVLAQRLVRRLCPHCRIPCGRPVEPLAAGRTDGPATFFRPGACDACGRSGYRGRMVINELLVMSDELRRLVVDRADARTIGHAAAELGMRTMYADGLMKARAGLTTVDEVLRVTCAT